MFCGNKQFFFEKAESLVELKCSIFWHGVELAKKQPSSFQHAKVSCSVAHGLYQLLSSVERL